MIRLFVLLLLPLSLFSLEAKVKLEIDKDQEFFVSKKFKVILKVMSTGFKISKLEVDYSDNRDFVIIAPQSASYNISEGEYSGVVYEYEVYPLKADKVDLKPWIVSFDASAGYGQESKHFTQMTQNKQLHIATVKGHGFLLATPSMQIQTEFSPSKTSFEVGDAVQRKTTIKAKEVVDLLIPSVKTYRYDGLQVYVDEAKLSQVRDENGALLSTRTQTETYVIVKDGNYSFDGQKIYWYNTQTNKVQSAVTQDFSFKVAALDVVEEIPKKKAEFNFLYLLYLLVFLSLISLLYKYISKKRSSDKKIKKRSRSLLVTSINPKEEV